MTTRPVTFSVTFQLIRYPRGEHSAKPPEIRQEIERMYLDYDADTRLELSPAATLWGGLSFTHIVTKRRQKTPDQLIGA
jgi:hypothetical protein